MSEIHIGEMCVWARAAGEIARHYFNATRGHRKSDQSLVSQADLEIEQFLRERIRDTYPNHGIIGEEQANYHIDREFVWALDPIDGTEAFLAGLPVWCVSIGVMRDGWPYLGVVYLPATQECYWNDAEGYAYWNDRVIHVTDAEKLSYNDWMAVPSRAHLDYQITFPKKTRSLGSLAVHCCYVARGSAPAALLGRPNLWDIAAGLALLKTAGGVAATLPDGAALDTRPMLDGSKSANHVIIAPPKLIDDMLEAITIVTPPAHARQPD
ncbi:MAG: inositol monophosphatase [Chloroflexaceae bacterium]|nr:inositol monophosphatase [Chloroflexaceae bacterium]